MEKNLSGNTMMLQVIEAQENMPILSAVTLYSSLLKFTLHVHPDRLDYADQVLVSFLIYLLVSSQAKFKYFLFCQWCLMALEISLFR